MIDANAARRLTHTGRKTIGNTELYVLETLIAEAASLGQHHVTVNKMLYMENMQLLKVLGYKLEVSSAPVTTKISWEE